MTTTQRIVIKDDPFLAQNNGKPWREQGLWPCRWLHCPSAEAPFVAAFRLRFTLEQAASIRIHLTADEQYRLFLDGESIARMGERGDPNNWYYESYQLELAAGEHVLVAQVWAMGKQRALVQMTVAAGFMLCAEAPWGNLLSTGHAPWDVLQLKGYQFTTFPQTYWRGARIGLDGGQLQWGFEHGTGDGWVTAEIGQSATSRIVHWTWYKLHRLQPATLPPLLDEVRKIGRIRCITAQIKQTEPLYNDAAFASEIAQWDTFLIGDQASPLTIPAHSQRRLIIDLDNYYCFYPSLLLSGGAGGSVQLFSAESLYHDPDYTNDDKGQRDQVEGKYFCGVGDTFQLAGGQQYQYEPLTWLAGRYLELVIVTQDQPLIIDAITFTETRYPLEAESEFSADDSRLTAIEPLLMRGLQMCSHSTYCDAPYYEELMYAGDTRIEIMLTYALSRDTRLAEKAIHLFDSSRQSSGHIQARYPCYETQTIAPFSLAWVMMLYDYAYWRDASLVQPYLAGMRATLEGYQQQISADNLLHAAEGWAFLDWHPDWEDGNPPDALNGVNCSLNWQYVYTLTLAARLEDAIGEPLFAQVYRQRATELAQHIQATFWNADRQLFAETVAHDLYTEHAQILALLSRSLSSEQADSVAKQLLTAPDLQLATYYFSHYLFEVFHLIRDGDALFARLGDWFALPAMGLKTPLERPEPSRSDCHAWASHPLFHYYATVLGIRPNSPSFKTVAVRPNLGHLKHAKGEMVHPAGVISAEYHVHPDHMTASITLPPTIEGELFFADDTFPLKSGSNQLVIPLNA